jgi:hypothetical protein
MKEQKPFRKNYAYLRSKTLNYRDTGQNRK